MPAATRLPITAIAAALLPIFRTVSWFKNRDRLGALVQPLIFFLSNAGLVGLANRTLPS
jgi:hypothetical protein